MGFKIKTLACAHTHDVAHNIHTPPARSELRCDPSLTCSIQKHGPNARKDTPSHTQNRTSYRHRVYVC